MRAWIYDMAILPLTGRWYAEVLQRVPDGATLLDVGIGTGGALARNAETLHAKDLRVVGVDIDPHYVERARAAMVKAGLADRVDVHLQSIYDHHGGPYQAVYFSASFMLMPDPAHILRHVSSLLSEEGRVYFTQTFQDHPSPWMERIKPLLGKLTTIEFGRVTYEREFLDTVTAGGCELTELVTMGTSGPRSYRLAVAKPNAPSATAPTS